MVYSGQNIRNVCIMGHNGNGKTSLVENLLFVTGAIDRQGRTDDGNTVCDSDPEEVKRHISISMSVAPVEYNGTKINLLDCPGFFDFSGEVMQALQVAESAIIVCSAKDGLTVGTERAWKRLAKNKLPRLIYISKLDEENSDFNSVYDALRDRFGKAVAPLIIPIWDEDKRVTGIVDVLHKKAYTSDDSGHSQEIEIPEDKNSVVEETYEALRESVAETSEEFMDKYFSGEDFTYAEMLTGLKAGVKDLSLVPVLCGSAVTGLGNKQLLNAIVNLLPSPVEGPLLTAEKSNGDLEDFIISPEALPTAYVFKTSSDQYGKYSYVKVLSGHLTGDTQMVDATTGQQEKLGRLYSIMGKKVTEIKELGCGDIGAIGKMDKVKTGDTLCDPQKVVKFEPADYPEPNYSMAMKAKTSGQEDKVAAGLGRINEEDLTFTVVNDPETHQMVITGTGDMQLDVLVSRLKNQFGVEVELSEPLIPYREKIRKKVEVQGKYKKQSGGHGQYGDVKIRFEPGESEEMEFDEEVFGGAVPRNYFPAVEKGLRESVQHGVLAGYPVVFLKATLYDGSYHPVDSSELAFKTAAQMAYRAGLPDASPVLLEPIGELKVTIPDQYTGDIIGDLNKRRGRVTGMNPNDDGDQVIEADVPMNEMVSYAIDLRSLSQSRGSFTYHFVRYEEAPQAVQEKAVAQAQAQGED